MDEGRHDHDDGWALLRAAVVACLRGPSGPAAVPALAGTAAGPRLQASPGPGAGTLWSEATTDTVPGGGDRYGDAARQASSEEDEEDRQRLIALVELARDGDVDAFGLLFDHYHQSVYRFLVHRTRSHAVAEDLTSDTFFRALRSMQHFRWQGKDFGAWLMTIARNLSTDHFKAGRTRLEMTTEDMSTHDDLEDGPEEEVMTGVTRAMLADALAELPGEQKDCVLMRFIQGLSIAETAQALGRTEGAVKQLQLRGVRNLAKQMPQGGEL